MTESNGQPELFRRVHEILTYARDRGYRPKRLVALFEPQMFAPESLFSDSDASLLVAAGIVEAWVSPHISERIIEIDTYSEIRSTTELRFLIRYQQSEALQIHGSVGKSEYSRIVNTARDVDLLLSCAFDHDMSDVKAALVMGLKILPIPDLIGIIDPSNGTIIEVTEKEISKVADRVLGCFCLHDEREIGIEFSVWCNYREEEERYVIDIAWSRPHDLFAFRYGDAALHTSTAGGFRFDSVKRFSDLIREAHERDMYPY